VIIVADDLGYNDLTFGGGGVAGGAVPTPNIDSLARQGVEFTRGYAGNATCAPSRAAILTGRYPTRFGFEFTPAPTALMRLVARMGRDQERPPLYFEEREKDVPPFEQEGLPPGEITIAELLRERGYRTLGLGKWHLGEVSPMRPEDQGFDEYLGFLAGGSMYLPKDSPDSVNSVQDFDPIDKFLWANLAFAVRKDGGPRFAPDAYMTDYLAREAARAVEANRNRPFFLYLAFNAPHTPLQALRSDYDALPQIESHTLRVYAAMIRALDRGVGLVLDALRANGLEENTLVLFTSDNGGANYIGLPDINRPYRGWKMTFFEGGVHTPFFARWPAALPKGARFDAPVAHVDLFATAAGAAGAALPSDRPLDSVDLVKLVRGEAPGRPHGAIFWRSGHYRTILADDWKLQVSERPKRTWLFDLRVDPTERTNLAELRPDKLRELAGLLAEHEAQMVAPSWPALIEAPIAIDPPLGAPVRPDDEFVYWAN
jgi:arylsulfatase A-like enzyme